MNVRRITAVAILICLYLSTGCSGGGTATTTPPAIAVTVGPATASLAPGANQTFTATIANDMSAAGVTWSLGTGVGTLSASSSTSVTYTAPATVPSATTVTLTATSKADGTKASSASISLSASPAISVTISPASITLAPAASQGFTATVANDASNAGVTWSIGAGPGTLSSSSSTSVTYAAPASVASATTLSLTATSKADTTKSATASISLSASAPSITVTLTPASITLAPGAAQAFTATVANDVSNAGVTWSIGSGPGALSASTSTAVTYTAPAGLPAAATVVLTATSKADTTKSATASVTLSAPTAPASQWVYYDNTGTLQYKKLNTQGDQIMDFSTAGYAQGAVPIPTASVAANVSPSGGDDTAAIQAAINTVSALPLNSSGLRGAVLLAPGNYRVSNTLTIAASGVVLRGSGSGTSSTTNTIITMAPAATPYPLVVMGSSSASPSYVGTATTISDSYVPSGTNTINVVSTNGLSVGSTIMIVRPVTQSWINFIGMNSATLPISACSGGSCNWITAGSTALKTDRTITAISGSKITLDAPMSDSIDSTYCGSNTTTVQAYTFGSRISQVGVEGLRAIAPVPATNLVPPTPSYQLVVTYAVLNAWANNLTAQDTLQSVDIENYSKQVTVSNVAITHTVTQTDSAKFMEFYVQSATQVLMDTVSDTADDMFFFSTSSTTQGPNVLRNATFFGNTSIEPHQRWATGLLVENTTQTAGTSGGTPAINFFNRGDFGSGHGWTIGWGVAWNTSAGSNTFQQPPGSQNWCIGCKGTQKTQAAPGGTVVLPQGAIDSSGTYVFPGSLYQAQLKQRLSM
jgi:hypothetical protein